MHWDESAGTSKSQSSGSLIFNPLIVLMALLPSMRPSAIAHVILHRIGTVVILPSQHGGTA